MNGPCELTEINTNKAANVYNFTLQELAGGDNKCKVQGRKVPLRRLSKYTTFRRGKLGWSVMTESRIADDYHIDLMFSLSLATDVILNTHNLRQTLYKYKWCERTENIVVNCMQDMINKNYTEMHIYLGKIRVEAMIAQRYVDEASLIYRKLDSVVRNCNKLKEECYKCLAHPDIIFDDGCSDSEPIVVNKYIREAFLG